MGGLDGAERASSHLSEVEALMWTVDRDPVLSATFGTITLLDCHPDMARLVARMGRAMAAAPRLRQCVIEPTHPFTTPHWSDDPNPDPSHHLRQVTLDRPGSIDQLTDFAAGVLAEPFDRSRPLWQFWVVDGLADGGAALVLKMHHTITDGVGGVRLWEQFIDFERHDATHPTGDDPTAPPGPGTGPGSPRGAEPPSIPVVGAVASAVGATARRGFGLAQRTSAAVFDLAIHPRRAAGLPGQSLAVTRSALRQIVVTDRSRSPLWAERSLERSVRTVDVDLDACRTAAHALGGTINDLFVTAVAGAAGAYHRHRGVSITDLRMAMPVSVRRDREAGGNAFVPTRMLVPAGEPDPVRRFELIHAELATVRDEPGLGLGEMVATVANLLPSAVAIQLARQQVGSVDFTTSNVRAARTKLYIGGARLEATYPVGPLGGTAFNASVLSYAGQMNIGIHMDHGAIDDPDLLVACLVDEFNQLLDAAD
jgi:diacylglycerol O-acyltransferase / wax synthase